MAPCVCEPCPAPSKCPPPPPSCPPPPKVVCPAQKQCPPIIPCRLPPPPPPPIVITPESCDYSASGNNKPLAVDSHEECVCPSVPAASECPRCESQQPTTTTTSEPPECPPCQQLLPLWTKCLLTVETTVIAVYLLITVYKGKRIFIKQLYCCCSCSFLALRRRQRLQQLLQQHQQLLNGGAAPPISFYGRGFCLTLQRVYVFC
jgi:hypothetical protein